MNKMSRKSIVWILLTMVYLLVADPIHHFAGNRIADYRFYHQKHVTTSEYYLLQTASWICVPGGLVKILVEFGYEKAKKALA